jgi:predicted ATPase
MLRSSRQRLHGQIAESLEAQSPELRESQPELFAQHYAEAGLVEKSVAFWGEAGRRSAARSAMAEAAAQFRKALDQLKLLPDRIDRQRQELDLWNALGAALQAAKGNAALETGQAYARARDLWERLGCPADFLHVPRGLARYYGHRGELDLSMRLNEDLLRLSRQCGDSGALALAYQACGSGQMLVGSFALSRSNLEAVLGLYEPISGHPGGREVGSHPQVVAQGYLGIVLFCLGFPSRALTWSRAAIGQARRLAHPPYLASSLGFGARLLSLIGDISALDERANKLIRVATEQRFPEWSAQGTIYWGWTKVKKDAVLEGISLLRSGLNVYRATGAEVWMPEFVALLAAAYELAGQTEESLASLEDALQIVERTGERWFLAELYRHKGHLLLRQGHSEAAEALYHKALSVAKEQEAKLWELRAAVSLARLRRGQNRRAEARALLVPVYSWFTEGFETPDLKEAKAVLDTLW